MIPLDLWTPEGRAEMREHLDLIAEIDAAEANLRAMVSRLPGWLRRERMADIGIPISALAESRTAIMEYVADPLFVRATVDPIPEPEHDAAPAAEAPASTAIATTSTAGALVVPERGIARDPEMVQQWRDDMTEAERRKFVARSEYPEMHP